MSFLNNICSTLGAKGVYIVCSVISGMITARWLGPHERGILAVATALPATIWMLASLGINQANVYFITKKTIPLKSIVSNAFVVPLIIAVFICVTIWFTQDGIILRYMPILNQFYLLLILLLVPIMMLQNSYLGVLRGTEKFWIINVRLVVRSIAGLGLSVVALIFFHGRVTSIIVGILLIEFLYTFWLLLEVNKICKISLSYDITIAKPIFLFGVQSYIQNMIGYLHTRIDIYLIAYFLKPDQIAFYDIAVIISEMLFFLPQSVTFVIFPKLVQLLEKERAYVVAQAGRIAIAITLVSVLFIFASGKYLIGVVYGHEYISAYIPLIVLLPGILISCTTSVTVPYFTSKHMQKVTIFASLLSLIANLGINILLIPRYGIIGAAVSTTITYSLFSVVLLIKFKCESKIDWAQILFIRIDDIRKILDYLVK